MQKVRTHCTHLIDFFRSTRRQFFKCNFVGVENMLDWFLKHIIRRQIRLQRNSGAYIEVSHSCQDTFMIVVTRYFLTLHFRQAASELLSENDIDMSFLI